MAGLLFSLKLTSTPVFMWEVRVPCEGFTAVQKYRTGIYFHSCEKDWCEFFYLKSNFLNYVIVLEVG